MNEVSCQALAPIIATLKERKIPITEISKGTSYDAAHLTNKRARIDWAAWVRIHQNGNAFWDDDEWARVGTRILKAPLLQPFLAMAALLFSLKDQYRWFYTPRSGVGNQLFTCCQPSFVDLGDNRIELRLTMSPGYEACREFIVSSKGFLEALPRHIGLEAAIVEERTQGEVTVFAMTLPPGGTVPFWRKPLNWFFAARTTATELKSAHEDLHQRYLDLEFAQKSLAQQATQLRTAHEISSSIHGDLDLDRALEAVVFALVQTAGFEAAAVTLDVVLEEQHVRRTARHGPDFDVTQALQRSLVTHSRKLGTIAVEGHVEQAEQLIEVLLPTISLALENALSFTAVTNYRTTLEHRVTERTAQLNSALDQVKDQSAARQRIFQNISHELRTPLSIIGLSTGDILYRDGDALSEKSKRRLDLIDESIHRLMQLFDGMLLLAAGQEGKLRIRPTHTDLAINLRGLVSAWQVSAEKHGLQLHYAGPERLTVLVDEAAIDRAAQNLLSNAVKFTPPGGTIEVRLEQPTSDTVQVVVQDSGVGMDREFLGRAFGRFEQGPAPVRSGERGSGIGLAIVKEIAEAHGGAATVDSERGRGSTFCVTVPKEQDMAKIAAQGEGSYVPELRQLAPDHDVTDVKPTSDVSPVGKPAKATILVAEDDPALRQFIVELLSREYRVIAAGDGLAALRLAKEHQPAMLISDIGMPGADGIELTRRFRQASADKLAPVILLTAYSLVETRLKGLDAGAVDYITKPFHPEELLGRVRAQLALKQVAMRMHEAQKLAGLGILSAGLAHELRNPANGVINALGPLKKLLPKEVLEPGTSTALLLDAMTTGAEQIAVLTRQLLGFSGQGELEVRDEAMSRIVDCTMALIEPTLNGRVIRRDVQFNDKVRCARGLVVQVLVNMLENAAYASPPGGEIVFSTRLEKDLVVFEVHDSGPGVPKELRERIFDPFFTSKPEGHGTGLGLTISKMIAERHGGNLLLMEAEKHGAFRLELPARPVELPKTSPLLENAVSGNAS